MSKIIRIFRIFFIEEYQIRGMFFHIDIFWHLQFPKHLVYWNHAYFLIAWFRTDVDLIKNSFMKKCYSLLKSCHLIRKILNVNYYVGIYLCYSIIVSSNGNSYCWYKADPASSWGSSKTNIVILGTQMCSCWLNNY